MPFWHRKSSEEEEQARRRLEADRAASGHTTQAEARTAQAEDIKLLARGGIPGTARRRLNRLKGEVAAGGSFNSDLSPSETALLHHGGYRPLGLVSGSALYAVGAQRGFAARDGELRVLSRAYNHATDLAVGRMAKEAREVRSHGVVGVRFSFARHEWSEDCVEVRVIGTAVLTTGARTGSPWLSDLAGQEWWALHQAGYEAAGLVYAHSVWFAATTAADAKIVRNTENREFRHLSDALKQSRDVANGRLLDMTRKLGAHGLVGVHVSRRVEDFELESDRARVHHLLTLSLIGTAVRYAHREGTPAFSTRAIVSLRSGKLEPTLVTTVPSAVFE
ncbi:MAG TPA: heavy metal-binding domain-containing protein [Chloroflexota bacterium]